MAERKNGIVWDAGKSPDKVFNKAAEQYAARITDRAYREAVVNAPQIQEVLQQVGTWDDNGAAGGDYIRAAAFRNADSNEAGVNVWYDLETYKVLHPKEDPDFDWAEKHISLRNQTLVNALYDEQAAAHEAWQSTVQALQAGVDDRVVATFEEEARFFWDQFVGLLR